MIHGSDPLFILKGGSRVNFDYLPQGGGPENLKKGGGSLVQGQAFLKEWREGGGLALFLFNFFKFYRFCI